MLDNNLIARNKDIIDNYYKYDAKYFAQKYSINVGTVYSIASTLKCTRDYLWEDHEKGIIEDYKNGLSLKRVGRKYNHDKGNIRKLLVRNKIYIRNQSESGQIYNFDHNFFKNIDTEEKAYWLGFIYADGNIYKNEELSKSVFQIALAEKDKKHLIKLKTSLKSEHKIYKDRRSYRFMINNIEFCDDLMKLGVFPRKSLECEFPKDGIIPDYLIRHFIRGYFDGDGSIREYKNTWKFEFIGTFNFLYYINKYLNQIEIPNKNLIKEKRNKDGKVFYYSVGGSIKYSKKSDTRIRPYFELIYNYLYKDASIYLDRKKKKFDKFRKIRNNA